MKRIAIVALTLLFSNLVFAQTNGTPWVLAYPSYSFCDFYGCTWAYGAVAVWVEGKPADIKVRLSYLFQKSDPYTGYQYESFDGIIPTSSLTYSGKPVFNGTYTVRVQVDTSTIADPSKVGSGGPIDITWTQKPMGWVDTTVGPTTQEDIDSIFKQTGKLISVENTASGWTWILPIGSPASLSSELKNINATGFTHTKK
jgi:hypothetical protein